MAGQRAGVAVRAGARAADWFRWDVTRLAVLRGLYLCLELGPAEIARRLGHGCTREGVTAAVRWHGLQRGRRAGGGGFTWTEDRKATLERLYVDRGLTREACAKAIGEGCTARKVTRAVALRGLAALREAKGHPIRIGRPQAQRVTIVRPVSRAGIAGATRPARRQSRWDGARSACGARRMAYADRFLAAGWSPGEVAWLFNLDARLLNAGGALA